LKLLRKVLRLKSSIIIRIAFDIKEMRICLRMYMEKLPVVLMV